MKLSKWIEKNFELGVLAVLLGIMSVLSFANVIARYIFRNAIFWSDEICCFCLSLSAFFALPASIRLGVSIKVDTFTSILSKSLQRILTLICNAIMVIFLVLFARGTFACMKKAMESGQASPALHIPMSVLYFIMGIAVILAILRYIQYIFKMLLHKEEEVLSEAEEAVRDAKEAAK
jgi:tripartite ATP-independent periplasmic transporter dctQ component